MNIAFLSYTDPRDKNVLSGTPYQLNLHIQKLGYQTEWIPIRKNIFYKLYSYFIRGISKIGKYKYRAEYTKIGAFLLSKSIPKEKLKHCDFIFAPFVAPALYKFKTSLKIIYLSDATFNLMVDYYIKNLTNSAIKTANIIEKVALEKSNIIIVSSDWAANSAINFYHQKSSKIKVIEFGANIEDENITEKEFKYNNHLHILFIGVNWKRKGGQLAIDTTKYLNSNNIKSTIHIIGAKEINEEIKKLPYVDYIGHLNKNKKEDYQKFVEIISLCHCMLLPTQAECSAIAFCEASAYGIPVFSHDTGGVSSYIKNGSNGYLLPVGSSAEHFGELIKDCLVSGELENMSRTCKIVYKQKLNWNIWAEKVSTIIKNLK